jgi:uncharacterized protein (DUF2147 family)
MKRFFIGLAAAAVTLAPAYASAKSSLEGRWRNGKMEILIGARLITNIRPSGANSYRANVYLADRGINASGTIRQSGPDRLNVRGCVLAIFCKASNWDRVSR